MWYIHTVKYYANLRKKKILSHASTWVNLKDIMQSEIRQSKRTNKKKQGGCQGLGGGGRELLFIMRSISVLLDEKSSRDL